MPKDSDNRPVCTSDIISFCEALGSLLSAGISPREGLALMQEDAMREGDYLSNLIAQYDAIGTLCGAMEAVNCFPAYLVHMTRLGEETGTLDSVMKSLAVHYTRELEIRRGIRSAVLYPAVMIGMMLVVICVLIVEVLPIFNQVFLQLGTEMTGFGRVLMDMGQGLRNYSLVFTLLLAAIILLAIYLSSAAGEKLRKKTRRFLPFLRNIQEKTSGCRLADAMSLGLKSGISPLESLAMARTILDDETFTSKLNACEQALEEGSDLGPALLNAGIYTGLQARMLSIGYKTGTLDAAMEEIAAKCQAEVDDQISNLLAILEPTLVALLSVLVGGILLSVMLPLLGILSSL